MLIYRRYMQVSLTACCTHFFTGCLAVKNSPQASSVLFLFLPSYALCLTIDWLMSLLIHDGLLMLMHFLGMYILQDSRIFILRISNQCAASLLMMRHTRILPSDVFQDQPALHQSLPFWSCSWSFLLLFWLFLYDVKIGHLDDHQFCS